MMETTTGQKLVSQEGNDDEELRAQVACHPPPPPPPQPPLSARPCCPLPSFFREEKAAGRRVWSTLDRSKLASSVHVFRSRMWRDKCRLPLMGNWSPFRPRLHRAGGQNLSSTSPDEPPPPPYCTCPRHADRERCRKGETSRGGSQIKHAKRINSRRTGEASFRHPGRSGGATSGVVWVVPPMTAGEGCRPSVEREAE